MEAGITALQRIGVPFHLRWSTDSDPHCKRYILGTHKPTQFFDDIVERKPDDEVAVDLYLWTPPCTSFSISGKQRGVAGEGKVIKHSLKYIQRHKPRVAVMENVKNLDSKKFKPVLTGMLAALENMGYKTFKTVLNAKDFKVPQSRERLFIVSIRDDSIHHDFSWPLPLGASAISAEVPWQACGIKVAQLGKMLGNSVPAPLIGSVLVEALYAAGLVHTKPSCRV